MIIVRALTVIAKPVIVTGALAATAAGGCLLVKREALRAAGGFVSIHNALIDDTSLAQRLKPVGPIWLGLTERVASIRPYPTFGSLRRMIARSAYDQLDYSPFLLAGTILGLALTYLWSSTSNAVSFLPSATSATPTLTFQSGKGDYPITLVVTNSAGQSSTMTFTLQYLGR